MPSWICHQLGSREHYSIPRALAQRGELELLQTDAWVRPGFQWLPRSLGQPALASRYHGELSDANVEAFTLGRLSFDLSAKLGQKDEWTRIMERDQWFQEKCLAKLENTLDIAPDSIVFSYAYTARELFKSAKRRGARCILGQVDPGPAELDWLREVLPKQVAQQIEDRPAKYWASWREEVAMADCILVNSEWSKDLLVERADVPEDKIEVIPLAYQPQNGTPSPRLYPDTFTQHRPLKMLFLGQLIHRKGMHLLLEAMQMLEGAPVLLDLVGPAGMRLDGLPANTRYHGSVDATAAQKFYADADLFVLPTLSDGFGLTQLEAAAQRLPLLTSRYCGQVVEDGKNGLILDPLSADSIHTAVQKLLAQPKRLAAMSAHELSWEHYSIEALGERLLQCASKAGQA